MAKHIMKVCRTGGQVRVTIPKLVVKGPEWDGVVHVIIEENKDGSLTVRRFVDGESLRGSDKKH